MIKSTEDVRKAIRDINRWCQKNDKLSMIICETEREHCTQAGNAKSIDDVFLMITTFMNQYLPRWNTQRPQEERLTLEEFYITCVMAAKKAEELKATGVTIDGINIEELKRQMEENDDE